MDEFCEIIKRIKAKHPALRIVQIINFASMDRELYYWTDEKLNENLLRYENDLDLEKEMEEAESLGES